MQMCINFFKLGRSRSHYYGWYRDHWTFLNGCITCYIKSCFFKFADVVGPGKFVTIKPIPIEKLREYCEINQADGNKAFREEFVVS